MVSLSAASALRVTRPLTVAPSSGAVSVTVGGVVSGLSIVTATLALVVLLPAASVALAVIVAGPSASVVESKLVGSGPGGSVPTTVPLIRNSTWLSASLSAASAARVTRPLTVVPSSGAVRLTVGGVVSGLSIVTATLVLVVLMPAASVARALIVAGPSASVLESQLIE